MGLGRGAEGVGPKNQILNKMETYDPGTRFFYSSDNAIIKHIWDDL